MQMNSRLENLENGQSRLEASQKKLETGLTKLEAKVERGFEDVNYNIKQIWKDLSVLERRIVAHEQEFHGVGIN